MAPLEFAASVTSSRFFLSNTCLSLFFNKFLLYYVALKDKRPIIIIINKE